MFFIVIRSLFLCFDCVFDVFLIFIRELIEMIMGNQLFLNVLEKLKEELLVIKTCKFLFLYI